MFATWPKLNVQTFLTRKFPDLLVNTVCRSVQAFLALELTLLYVDCMLQTVLLQAVLLQAVVSDSTNREQKVLIHKRLLCKHTWVLFHERMWKEHPLPR